MKIKRRPLWAVFFLPKRIGPHFWEPLENKMGGCLLPHYHYKRDKRDIRDIRDNFKKFLALVGSLLSSSLPLLFA